MAEGKLLKMGEEYRKTLKSKNVNNSNNEYGMNNTGKLEQEGINYRGTLLGKNGYNTNNQYGVNEDE